MRSIVPCSFHRSALICFSTLLLLTFCLSYQATAQSQADTLPAKAKRTRDWKLSDYLQIHGFVDTQYDHEWQRENDGTMTQRDVIMLRRARFEFAGKLHPMLDFRLQADMAFTPRLLDAWLRVKFCKYAHLWIGQIKTPYTMDNFLTPLQGTVAVSGVAGRLYRCLRHPGVCQRSGNRRDAVGYLGGLQVR